MANSIAYTKNYTAVLDEVYKRAACSTCLNSPRRMARAGRNAKEIMVPKIEVTGLGDYTRNVGYKTGSITYEFETKTFNYDRGIKLLADVMDVEEAGVLDCFVAAGSELQRTQVAPEADAFTFSEIAGHAGVTPQTEDFADAEAEDVLASLRAATNAMDEAEVTTGSRVLFITPTLKGVLDDFSLANPARSNRVLERFSRIVEVPQTRFYSAIELPLSREALKRTNIQYTAWQQSNLVTTSFRMRLVKETNARLHQIETIPTAPCSTSRRAGRSSSSPARDSRTG